MVKSPSDDVQVGVKKGVCFRRIWNGPMRIPTYVYVSSSVMR